MAGMDDNLTVIGDWTPNPSPRAFMPSFLNEEFGSRSFYDLLAENGNDAPLLDSEKKRNFKEENEEVQFSGNLLFELNSFNAHTSSSRGGLAERMAARGGFNAPKLNTARIRSANMASSSSDIRSPYLTIPPGLSPTTLLDSPVFLSNMAQPSPTTGKVLFAQGNNANSVLAVPDESKDHMLEDIAPEAFAFKPHLEPSSSYFSRAENKKPLPRMEVSVQSEHPVNFPKQRDFNHADFSDSSERKIAADDIVSNQRSSDSFMGNEQSSPPDDQPDGEADPRGEFSSVAVGNAPAEDGYNWRKYGQKQVKGSEYPRSYYKCTHPNCQVKKKVERNHEGQITEIIYKGTHNHPKPPPNRRSAVASGQPFSDAQFDGSEPFLASTQNGSGGHGWRNDGLEATSSASAAAEFCDPTTSMQTQDGPRFESADTIDVSSTLSNDEDEDDRATHGSVSLGCDGDGDETESKRRKLESCAVEMSAASRAVREPRVVVQTTSEVDILDDGYRWRKYGQKVVKGNPNPRSYYKCTNPGCTVRKHVERASHDLKSVITTYEGKHNHDVPAARNSGSHASTLISSTTATASVSQAHSIHRKPEPTHDGLMRFDGRAALGAFGMTGREPLGPAASFGFGMPRQGMTSLGITGMSSMAPMKMQVLPPGRSFMGHQQVTPGFMMPKGEPKEEPMSESGLPMSSGASVYHQMMGRLPLGPQL